ncbi:hypothetical protein GCM10022393_26420 [Aquimarina addita]|uniref:Uncharacterized protein n=1 Tax=Aquimarina addita TaxID=870485 RepID=A0ABP6UQ19_9FLAO
MRNVSLCFLCCLHFITGYTQEKKYHIDSDYTIEIIEKLEEVPIVYEVIQKKITTTVYEELKKKTTAYTELEKAIKKLENDSIRNTNLYHKQEKKYQQILKISTHINNFLSSKESHQMKKKHLIKAQKIADKYHLNTLIYADDAINPTKKSQFFILEKKSLDLKIHLKKIIWSLEKKNPKPVLDFVKLDNKIKNLRKQISLTAPFEIVATPKKIKKSALFIGIPTDLSNLSGNFKKNSNLYYIMSQNSGTLLNNQLVAKDNIIKAKIFKNHILASKHNTLINNIENDKLYLIEADFFNIINRSKEYLPSQNKVSSKVSKIDNNGEITYPIKKYESMIMKCKELTAKLKKHNKIRKNSTMTLAQRTAWKKDLSEATSLHKEIEKFSSIYQKEKYPVQKYTNRKILNDYKSFNETLSNSIKYTSF